MNGATLRVGMRRTEIERKFDETCAELRRSIVAFAETCPERSRRIERFLDTPVKRYSSGVYVRLAFAVAAHPSTDSGRRLEPETCPEQRRRILLVDESLS